MTSHVNKTARVGFREGQTIGIGLDGVNCVKYYVGVFWYFLLSTMQLILLYLL